jgi:hypothetical protein
MSEQSPEELSFPINWDRLSDDADEDLPRDTAGDVSSEIGAELGDDADAGDEALVRRHEQAPVAGAPAGPPTLNLVAAAWADLVALLAFVVAELIAVVVADYEIKLAALPWVVALALAWWCAASLVLVVVRRGTPGMLMAGVVFKAQVSPSRFAAIILVALVLVCLLGLPALLGAQRSPLSFAAGSPLACIGGLDQE